MGYDRKERADLRCPIHRVAFVSFPGCASVKTQLPTRGCPVCVGEIREAVRRERRRSWRPLRHIDLMDRRHLFDGL
jgi:hypothetical protein